MNIEIQDPPGNKLSLAPGDGAGAVGLAASAPSAVERAEAALSIRDGLQQKLDAARASLDEFDEERKSLAFAAHVEGGEAERKLTALNKRRQLALADVETLETAILEASRRVSDAEREAELAADSEKAERALEIASGLVERAQKMDAALAILAEESIAYKNEVDELNFQLGISHPSGAQFQAAITRVLRTAIIFTPMRPAIEFIAPGERRTMMQAAEAHAAAISCMAEARLPSRAAAE